MKVLIVLHHKLELWMAPAWFGERLKQQFADLQIIQRSTFDGIEDQLQGAEVVFTLTLRPEQFRIAEKLRWIHCPAAAVHALLFPELVNSDVILTNGRDVHGRVVAEQVMAMILALAKNLHLAVRYQLKNTWGQDALWNTRPRLREIAGATLGLVGVGSIGRDVAKHASSMGMRVIAVREHPEKGTPEGVEKVYGPSELDLLLSQSDYVVLAVPTVPSTHKLINADRLARMKPEACLINVGRGQLVDEVALASALQNKIIGAAALDVFDKEPLPADSPLWQIDNLLITPHTGGLTEKLWERQYALFSENIRRYQNHEPLLALVNKSEGY